MVSGVKPWLFEDSSFGSRWYKAFLQQQVAHISGGNGFYFYSLSGQSEGWFSDTNLQEVDIE